MKCPIEGGNADFFLALHVAFNNEVRLVSGKSRCAQKGKRMAGPGFFKQRDRSEKKERPRLTRAGLQTARKMLSYMRPYRWIYAVGMLFLALSTLTSLGFVYVLGPLVNAATGAQDWMLKDIDNIALLLIGVVVGQMIFSFLRIFTFSQVTQRTMADIRYDLFGKMMSLPISFFERRRVGELTSRITTDVEQIQTVLSTSIAEFLRQIATLAGGITFILWKTPTLALFMLMIFPPLVLVAVIFGRFIGKNSKKTQDGLAETNVVLDESLHNITIVKAFTNEWSETMRYREKLQALVRMAVKTDTYRGFLISFVIFSLFGSFVLVMWRGGHMVMDGQLQVGDLLSFIMFMAFIGGSLAGLPDVYTSIAKAIGATERLNEILQEQPEAALPKSHIPMGAPIRGEITYQDVHFTYESRADVEVLRGINLTLAAGEKIALAGSSGAGKSTIAQLLMRFYEISSGQILIDGKPIGDYDLHHLRRHVGIVPQEVILFGGSIRENIGYGKQDATEDEIKEAARQANALEFIEEFPEGFDTLVGDRGVKLSGGQRQRIAIARAILKNPAILILDEATSSLDASSENLVQQALDTLMIGRTTLIIAHRLGTIRNVDRIYVLDHGQIVESGSHEQLIANPDGNYSNLVALQMSMGASHAI
jgi:ABC-type multidrug transport system fused ATPase/permease subunit